MKALAELVFVGEIMNQAKIAQRAAERLQATTDHFDELEVWCSIQSILVAAGNISKILWPSRKSSAARGERLRTLLNVDDRNLLSDRNQWGQVFLLAFRHKCTQQDLTLIGSSVAWFGHRPGASWQSETSGT